MTEKICGDCQTFCDRLPQIPRAQYAGFIKWPVEGGYIALRTRRHQLVSKPIVSADQLKHDSIEFAILTNQRRDEDNAGRIIWKVGLLCHALMNADKI